MSMRRPYARKLSPGQVREIRRLKTAGWNRKAIAAAYSISTTALHHILSFASYKDVK